MFGNAPNVQSMGRTVIFSFFNPSGKAGGNQIRRCKGIAVKYDGGTLGTLALARSGFCNAGDKLLFYSIR